MHLSSKVIAFYVASLLFTLVAGDVNVTIDDQLGDPINGNLFSYKPAGAWASGVSCGCNANPDLSQVKDGTWTWTKFQPDNSSDDPFYGKIRSATIPFFGESSRTCQDTVLTRYKGAAVYVKAVLFNSKFSPRGNSDFTFFVDDQQQAVFQQMSTNDSTYDYNVTIFSMNNLSNQQHVLRIEIGHLNETAVALLDSVIYTYVSRSATQLHQSRR